MGILRPITESQAEISLVRDDGEMSFMGDFISVSEFGFIVENGERICNPVELRSCFDPIHFKELIKYCTNGEIRDHKFTIVSSIHYCGNSREVYSKVEALGCELTGFSLPKLDRESGEVAYFKLTFQPSRISSTLT